MISITIILVLAYFYYSGARRGAALQWLHVGGYALSFLAATALARPLGEHFTLLIPYPSATNAGQFAFYSDKIGLTLDDAFYRGFAFFSGADDRLVIDADCGFVVPRLDV